MCSIVRGSGAVIDSDDELLGTLLRAMYPCSLMSVDLPTFLHPPKRDNLIGNYTMFWRRDLERIDIAEAPGLLDAFAARVELRRGQPLREYAKAVGTLLAQALEGGADEIPDEKLLNWLDAACGMNAESLLENEHKQVVQQWIQARPHRYFSLLDLALHRYANKQNRVWSAEARLHGAKAPANEAAWWLAKAKATEDEVWAKEYFVQALHAIPNEYGPEVEGMLIACENLGAARGWNESLAARLTCSLEHWQWKLDEAVRRKERARDAAERRDFYHARLAEFSLPLVPLEILDTVADVYEHGQYDIDGTTPEERLTDFFAGDKELVKAALTALRNTICDHRNI